jgi:cytochrome c peroxidase
MFLRVGIGVALASAMGCGSGDDASVAPPDSGAASDAKVSDGGGVSDATADSDGGATADGAVVTLSASEAAIAQGLSPLPAAPPADPTNRVADDPGAAALGQRLFFERRFSGALVTGDDGTNGGLGPAGATGRISCASCHAGPALADNRSLPGNVSLGADFLPRNAPPLLNSAFYKWTNWAGRFSALWELPIGVVENAKNMNGDRLRVAHLIVDKYLADYQAVFGPLDPAIGSDATRFPPSGKPKAAGAVDGPWELMAPADRTIVNGILANFGKALEAYVRKLVGGVAPFDRYVAGETGALSTSEVRGLKLFVGDAKCVSCHSGPLMSDNLFHNLGLPQSGPHVPATDNGRFADIVSLLASPFNTAGAFSDDTTTGRLDGLVSPATDGGAADGGAASPSAGTKGQFRTAALRNVAVTAPYMHAGQLATLADVIDYYDTVSAAVPAVGTLDPLLVDLHLTAQQKADLVAFLGSLTADAAPAGLSVDTSAP